MADNTTLIGGVTTTVQQEITLDDLAPNNYLTIIWRDTKTGETFNSLDIDNKQALEYTVALQNSIDQAISGGKISYAGQSKYINLESVAKYLAQNTIKAGTKRNVINALIGLASGSKTALSNSTKNLIVNVFGSIADDVAKSFGYTDPHEIFSSFANENTIKLFTELGNKTQKYIDDCISKFSNKKKDKITSSIDTQKTKTYAGLIMGITMSDTESMDITIPRKKVEDGSNYTTHLLPQPFKKEFNVILTNKVLTPDFNRTQEIKNIEFVKDKLTEIAKSKTTFDIYVRLSNDVMYKRSNVAFSSLSFTKDENSGNGYTASFTIEPINTFKVKTFVSNRKYFSSDKSGYTNNTKGSGTGESSNSRADKTSDGKPILVGSLSRSLVDKNGYLHHVRFNTVEDANIYANKNNMRLVYKTPPNRFGVHYFFVDKSEVGIATEAGNAYTDAITTSMIRQTFALKKDMYDNGDIIMGVITKDGAVKLHNKTSYKILPSPLKGKVGE